MNEKRKGELKQQEIWQLRAWLWSLTALSFAVNFINKLPGGDTE